MGTDQASERGGWTDGLTRRHANTIWSAMIASRSRRLRPNVLDRISGAAR
jgi:hypothetical protein